MRLLLHHAAVALLAAGLTLSLPLQAADRPNVLVFTEDSDDDTVPRDSRVNKRVLRAVESQLDDMGIDVYDETAVTLDQGFAQGRTRRTDAEIIDVSRAVQRPPIDVAVIYSIYSSARKTAAMTKVRTRIEGRMLQVNTGRFLGSFEVETPKEWTAPAKCNRECILETIGEDARIIGNDLGAVLAEKLAWMVDGGGSLQAGGAGLPMAYTLEFDGFTPEEMLAVEEYLVIFSGYESHRPIYSSQRRAEIWYESSIKSGKLTRNLNRMLAELDLRGMVQFSGNTVKIQKITLRGQQSKPVADDGW